jgi:hypothetical protein
MVGTPGSEAGVKIDEPVANAADDVVNIGVPVSKANVDDTIEVTFSDTADVVKIDEPV